MKTKRTAIFWRYALVSVAISALAVAIVWSAVNTTVVHAEKWNAKADSLLSRVYFAMPERGDILADDGTVLATNVDTYSIYIDYRANARKDSAFVANIDALSDSMAAHYPRRNKNEWKQYLAAPLAEKAEKRKTNHLLLRDVSYGEYELIRTFPFFRDYKKKYTHGLYTTSRKTRVTPYGSMARRSVGRCNYVSIPKFEGATRRRDSTDVLHGYSGLEYALDSILFGHPGTSRMTQLTHGVRSRVADPAIDGSSVHTTIDIDIQDIVESELMDMLKTTEAQWGTCIIMEVPTGKIKAISNLDRDPKTGEYIEAMNYAVRAYEPGSVMKPISMIVAMNKGYAFPVDRVMSIGHSYSYAGGSPIRDSHSPGALPVSRFIEYSSNIGMTKLLCPNYDNDHLNDFRTHLREIGFFEPLNTGIAGERVPYVPTISADAGGRVSLSRMVYGYSTMIPPLYTCALYNAIANDGKFVRPRMVQAVISPDGIRHEMPVSYVRDSILSKKNARLLQAMIREVVWGEGGTAKALRSDVVEIAGKTGTARITRDAVRDSVTGRIITPASYVEGHYRLAFCGFFPYKQPQYTCMVLISDPSPAYRGAGRTSGMVLKNIALKMHARGMLDNSSDYREGAEPTASLPTLYAVDDNTHSLIKSVAGAAGAHRMRRPAQAQAGVMPDLRGLGVREALSALSEAGFSPRFHGTGYAVRQTVEPGQHLAAGSKVDVYFTSR